MNAQELEKYVFAEGKIQPPFNLPIKKSRFALYEGTIFRIYRVGCITYYPTAWQEFANVDDAFTVLNKEVDGIYLLELSRI